MGARDSVLVGAAGEDYVLYRLHRMGLLAAACPLNAYAADIIVFSPAMQVGCMVQVKTRTTGADHGWHMGEKHERLIHPRLFYVFLDLQPDHPESYVMPSDVVSKAVAGSHRAWLALPGQGGRVRRDSPMRRIAPVFHDAVPGFPVGWMDAYRERWDYLTSDVPTPVEGAEMS